MRRTELRLSTADARGLRIDPPRQGQGRRRRHAAQPGRGRDVGTVCIVGKSWDYHVLEALQTTLDEGVAMVADSVRFLKGEGLRVMFDAEHFFDGYKANPEFALRVLEAAAVNGADHLVLCDTNGGSLPHEVERIVGRGRRHLRHDVTDRRPHSTTTPAARVANALAGVRGGARQRAGHDQRLRRAHRQRNLTTIIPNLTLKMGVRCLPEGRLERLTAVSHHVAELVNLPPHPSRRPTSARRRSPTRPGCTSPPSARPGRTYEHVDPDVVGNGTRFVVSELAGRSGIVAEGQGARARPRRGRRGASSTS